MAAIPFTLHGKISPSLLILVYLLTKGGVVNVVARMHDLNTYQTFKKKRFNGNLLNCRNIFFSINILLPPKKV